MSSELKSEPYAESTTSNQPTNQPPRNRSINLKNAHAIEDPESVDRRQIVEEKVVVGARQIAQEAKVHAGKLEGNDNLGPRLPSDFIRGANLLLLADLSVTSEKL